jgi:hypothetical protein
VKKSKIVLLGGLKMVCNLNGYATLNIFNDGNAELIKRIEIKENIKASDIGVNEFETINWLIRGTPSELYKSIKPKRFWIHH